MEHDNKPQSTNDLPDFQRKYISYKTASELLRTINQTNSLKDFVEKYFEEVYFLEVYPHDISKYDKDTEIYDIIRRHTYYAEGRPISIMIFKLNQSTMENAQTLYQEMKELYGDMVIMDDTKYRCIVGFFGGTTGRNNQLLIEEIKSEIPVKILDY